MDDVQIEVVEHFKYLGSMKSADGNFNNGVKSRIGMGKKRTSLWRHLERQRNKQRAEMEL